MSNLLKKILFFQVCKFKVNYAKLNTKNFNKENQTLTYLYSKKKNRIAKDIYLFFYIFVLLHIAYIALAIIILTFSSENTPESRTIGNMIMSLIYTPGKFLLIALAVFEIIKRIFYYITLRTINPKK